MDFDSLANFSHLGLSRTIDYALIHMHKLYGQILDPIKVWNMPVISCRFLLNLKRFKISFDCMYFAISFLTLLVRPHNSPPRI